MCGGGGWALVPHYHAVGVWHSSHRDLDSVVACLCLHSVSIAGSNIAATRDYLNAWQLVIALGLLMVGAVVSGLMGKLTMVAPAVVAAPVGAPAMMPFLFITIACGAISGFHSLVASGTTSKQLSSESDAVAVGFGSMLVEGALAVMVIVACCAGIGMGYPTDGGSVLMGQAAWESHYASWGTSAGLASKLSCRGGGGSQYDDQFGCATILRYCDYGGVYCIVCWHHVRYLNTVTTLHDY